jgi:hypothetical protein
MTDTEHPPLLPPVANEPEPNEPGEPIEDPPPAGEPEPEPVIGHHSDGPFPDPETYGEAASPATAPG